MVIRTLEAAKSFAFNTTYDFYRKKQIIIFLKTKNLLFNYLSSLHRYIQWDSGNFHWYTDHFESIH